MSELTEAKAELQRRTERLNELTTHRAALQAELTRLENDPDSDLETLTAVTTQASAAAKLSSSAQTAVQAAETTLKAVKQARKQQTAQEKAESCAARSHEAREQLDTALKQAAEQLERSVQAALEVYDTCHANRAGYLQALDAYPELEAALQGAGVLTAKTPDQMRGAGLRDLHPLAPLVWSTVERRLNERHSRRRAEQQAQRAAERERAQAQRPAAPKKVAKPVYDPYDVTPEESKNERERRRSHGVSITLGSEYRDRHE